MKKAHPVLQFVLLLVFSFAIFFIIHSNALKTVGFAPYGNGIILSYSVNLMLVALIFGVLFLLRNKLKNQIGFLFMAGSLLKFLIFFLIFYPGYRSDGVMDKLEFAAFFAPYVLGLVIETIFTAKILNNNK